MTRTPLIAGNWKMHCTVAEAEELVAALLPRVAAVQGVDVAVCPPFTALGAVVDSVRGSQLAVYAQTMHDSDSGAYTGEVSPPMLVELDVDALDGGDARQEGRDELLGLGDRAVHLPVAGDQRCAGHERASTPGSLRPSISSSEAPPPVERWS